MQRPRHHAPELPLLQLQYALRARTLLAEPAYPIVEDSATGVEAARAAGMRVMHFTEKALETESREYRAFQLMSDLPRLVGELEQPS